MSSAAGLALAIGLWLPHAALAQAAPASPEGLRLSRRPASAAAITAFNLLPTNHLYYGFADQVPFQNLINPFVQLRLAPHPKVSLNLFAHWLELAKRNDARYTGSGALRRRSARAAPPRRRPPPRPG